MKLVEIENITKKYDNNIIFSDYNFSISSGEFVCITGVSGAGKSTLLNIIGLLDKNFSGKIKICDCENPKINSKDGIMLLRKHINYLFQNYGLVDNMTVEENVKIATKFSTNRKNCKTILKSALTQVGLAGYEKKKVYQLSGGEQQRVALAKIIVHSGELILADEPTGSLDVQNKEIVMSILKRLNEEGKTIIMVTHDKEVTKYATRIEELKKE